MKWGWLTKHRQKPKHIRDNIAFTISAGFTVIVAGVWFAFGSDSALFNSASRGEAQAPEAFSTFLDQLSEQMAGQKDADRAETATSTAAFPTPEATGTEAEQTTYGSLQREAAIRIVPTASSTASSSREYASSTVIY